MAILVNAYLKGNVKFQEIAAFIQKTEDGDAKLELTEIKRDLNDSFAWLHFHDKEGKDRAVFCIFVAEDEDVFPSELRDDAKEGYTLLNLASDEEGRRVLRSIAEQFGGWFQPFDNILEFERIWKQG